MRFSVKMPADDHALPTDALQEEARTWVRLLTTQEVKPWDARGFQRWLRTSPAHKDAFNEAKRVWQAMRPAAGDVLRNNPAIAALHQHIARGPDRGRRGFLGAAMGGAAVAAVAGVAVLHPPFGLWPAPAQWQADYRTATGEQRTLALAGRVNVTLNTRTSARRRMNGAEAVGLDLIDGEAAIDLTGSGRAFGVVAGRGRSLAEAGRFDVKYLDGKVCVTCLEGAVRVEHGGAVRLLQARQQLVYDADSISSIASAEPEVSSAWRKGELVFRQTRLGDVIDEINRYRSGRVVLMNTAERDRAVSGRFAIASLDTALWQLQHTYKLDARALPGGLLILS
jgi:transmembrane sensor